MGSSADEDAARLRREVGMSRWLGLVVAVTMLTSPGLAQSEGPSPPTTGAATEWQSVIHQQVQAFRDHDAATALSFAAAPFHQQFSDPEAFLLAILNAGYAPIMESRSESF